MGGREMQEGREMGTYCICITDSLCYKAETTTPLSSNYIPIKMLKKKKKNQIEIFPKRKCNGQQAHEKLLNIANRQGKANQNYNELTPHTCQNGYHQKEHK